MPGHRRHPTMFAADRGVHVAEGWRTAAPFRPGQRPRKAAAASRAPARCMDMSSAHRSNSPRARIATVLWHRATRAHADTTSLSALSRSAVNNNNNDLPYRHEKIAMPAAWRTCRAAGDLARVAHQRGKTAGYTIRKQIPGMLRQRSPRGRTRIACMNIGGISSYQAPAPAVADPRASAPSARADTDGDNDGSGGGGGTGIRRYRASGQHACLSRVHSSWGVKGSTAGSAQRLSNAGDWWKNSTACFSLDAALPEHRVWNAGRT